MVWFIGNVLELVAIVSLMTVTALAFKAHRWRLLIIRDLAIIAAIGLAMFLLIVSNTVTK